MRYIIVLKNHVSSEHHDEIKRRFSEWLRGDPTIPLLVNGTAVEIITFEGLGFYCDYCGCMQKSPKNCENCGSPIELRRQHND